MCAHENMMECGGSAKFENFADLQTLMLSTIADSRFLSPPFDDK
jgi:hypothetical protein